MRDPMDTKLLLRRQILVKAIVTPESCLERSERGKTMPKGSFKPN